MRRRSARWNVQKVARILEKRQMNMTEWARKSCVSRRTVTRFMSGQGVDFASVAKLMQSLKVPVTDVKARESASTR